MSLLKLTSLNDIFVVVLLHVVVPFSLVEVVVKDVVIEQLLSANFG